MCKTSSHFSKVLCGPLSLKGVKSAERACVSPEELYIGGGGNVLTEASPLPLQNQDYVVRPARGHLTLLICEDILKT